VMEHRTGCPTPAIDRSRTWLRVHAPSLDARSPRGRWAGARRITSVGLEAGTCGQTFRSDDTGHHLRPVQLMIAIPRLGHLACAVSIICDSPSGEIPSMQRWVDGLSLTPRPTRGSIAVSAHNAAKRRHLCALTAGPPRVNGHTKAGPPTRLSIQRPDTSTLSIWNSINQDVRTVTTFMMMSGKRSGLPVSNGRAIG
jgi:hypothetical protein